MLTGLILIYLSIKTMDNVELVREFRYQTLDTIKADSSDKRHKFDLLDNETTKFSGRILEDTSHVREAVNYLIGLMGLFIIIEFSFLIATVKSADK